ncbi:MAG TPA: hypothetical protein VF789_01635 [Thermoanaerobaculia bacterium]
MHLFIELLTLIFFLGFVAHAVAMRGRAGAGFFAAMLLLGFLRENLVILRDILYGFSPLHLLLGRAPLIASIIWGYSIYAAVVWAEAVSGERFGSRRPSGRFLGLAALFMIALACFYEPFLKLIDMARWQEGTRSTLDVPWITWIGYPTMAVLFLPLWGWAMGMDSRAKRLAALLIPLPFLAFGHALALQALKSALGW